MAPAGGTRLSRPDDRILAGDTRRTYKWFEASVPRRQPARTQTAPSEEGAAVLPVIQDVHPTGWRGHCSAARYPPPSPKTTKKGSQTASLKGIRQRPILPGRVQPSTFGTGELNFCVRYGNRWDLSVITTGNCLEPCDPDNCTRMILKDLFTIDLFVFLSDFSEFVCSSA